MSLGQALVYFFREAFSSLLRSWKVSLVAVLTIALGLLLTGLVLTVTNNLGDSIGSWGRQARVVVYLRSESNEEEVARTRTALEEAPWIEAVSYVSEADAAERFREVFSGLGDLIDNWSERPLPASLEATLSAERLDEARFSAWLEELNALPATQLVDDDRDWLRQLRTTVGILRTLGLVLAGALLVTAVFTTASVVRLTAYLYLDEIAVMRMVGATEFFIRGPFYVEGLLQGLFGGLLSVAVLEASLAVLRMEAGTSLWLSSLVSQSLSWGELVALVAVGGAAGLLGAVLSLRRERLLPAEAED